jgi:hypothetical protein
MKNPVPLFVIALWMVLAACGENTALHDYVNDHIIPAAFDRVEIADTAGWEFFGEEAPNEADEVGEKAGAGIIFRPADERTAGVPGYTVIKIVLRNSRNAVYTPVFLGNDANLVEDFRWYGTQVIYCKLQPMAEKRALDITLRLAALPGHKSPDDMPLPLACARRSAEARVEVFPAETGIERGGSLQFWAIAVGVFGSQQVTWKVADDAGNPVVSTVDTTGLLTVAPDETAATLTVKAVSVGNPAISGTARVTVEDMRVSFNSVTAYPSGNYRFRFVFAFDREIPGLSANDITLWDGETETPLPGPLTENAGVYEAELTLPGASWARDVRVAKPGYAIASSTRTVNHIEILWGIFEGASLRYHFGIDAEGYAGVWQTFQVLHAFIQGGGLTDRPDFISLGGSHIDLEGGLKVAAYPGSDGNGGGDFAIAGGNEAPRLIVAGINSFNDKNQNNTPHLVFHFKNIPVTRRMNESNTNVGGYRDSEMRKYLVPFDGDTESGAFLAGLEAAGVPLDVLWKPRRYVSSRESDGPALIEDALWLPTEWEIAGSHFYADTSENEENQAGLAYYTNDVARWEKEFNGSAMEYWNASSPSAEGLFCNVAGNGVPNRAPAVWAQGCVPAFCVQ